MSSRSAGLPLPFGAREQSVHALEAARARFKTVAGGRPKSEEDLLALFVLSTQPQPDYGCDPTVAASVVQLAKNNVEVVFPEDRKQALLRHAAAVLCGHGKPDPQIDARITQFWRQIQQERARFLAESEETWKKTTALLPYDLLAHQKEGLQHIVDRNYRCLVHDDQGLGKTIEILAALALRHSEGTSIFPLVIVSPSSLVGTWKDHVRRWLQKLSPVIVGFKDLGPEGEVPEGNVVVCGPYGSLTNVQKQLQLLGPEAVVYDESHYLRSVDTQRGKAALLVRGRARTVLLATGTASPNGRPVETFLQLKILDPNCKELRHSEFTYRYCAKRKMEIHGRTVYDVSGASRPIEYGKLLHRLSFRRLKAEYKGLLPDKTRYVLTVELEHKEQVALEKLVEEVKSDLVAKGARVRAEFEEKFGTKGKEKIDRQVEAIEDSAVLAAMTKLRQATGKMKVRPAVERCLELVEEGRRVILFCYHPIVAIDLHAKLQKKLGDDVLLGTSDLNEQQRFDLVASANKSAKAVVLTYAYCEGVTLNAFDWTLMVERHWIPDKELQAEDRNHRIGQTKDVAHEYMHAPGTIDDTMTQIHTTKETRSLQAVGSAATRVFKWLEAR